MRFSSAPRRGSGKAYYKGYNRQDAGLARLAELSVTHSISSHWYGGGVTARGEAVDDGHRATGSIERAGEVLLLDFDKGLITAEELSDKLQAYPHVVTKSKNWTSEFPKLHAFVACREIPQEDFRGRYRRLMQDLGLEGMYDPAVAVYSAQLAPGEREGAIIWEGGEPLDFVGLTPLEMESDGTGSGEVNFVPLNAVFTISADQRQVAREDMVSRVQRERHIRVHCLDGLEHDGRKDTAFVSISDAGNVYYRCSGGRCGRTLYLENPFSELGELEVVESPKLSLDNLIAQAEDLLPQIHAAAQGPRASIGQREAAVVAVIEAIIEKLEWASIDDQIRQFDGRYWKPVFSDAFTPLDLVKRVAERLGWRTIVDNTTVRNRIISCILTHTRKREVREGRPYLNLRNGMLNTRTCELEPHRPDELFTYVLDYDYENSPAPVWWGLVNKIMMGNSEMVEALQEAMGYLILPDFNLEKVVIFEGAGSNGKSTVLNVLEMIVDGHFSAAPFHALTRADNSGDYQRAQLRGKLINITEELETKDIKAAGFKNLASGRNITAREPAGKPFVIKNAPKQICATNSVNHIMKEKSLGFERRLHIIPFRYTVQAKDKTPRLMEELQQELGGILYWMIEGAKRVLARNELARTSQMDQLHESLRIESNPMLQFINQCIRKREGECPPGKEGADLLMTVSEFYSRYKEFCVDQGFKYPLTQSAATREAKRLELEYVESSVRILGKPRKIRGFFVEWIPEDQQVEYDPQRINMLTVIENKADDEDLPF